MHRTSEAVGRSVGREFANTTIAVLKESRRSRHLSPTEVDEEVERYRLMLPLCFEVGAKQVMIEDGGLVDSSYWDKNEEAETAAKEAFEITIRERWASMTSQ